MKKIVNLLTSLFLVLSIQGQNIDLSLYLENYDADTTNLLAPEVFSLPCSEYYFSYQNRGMSLSSTDSLFAIAQPYNTDTAITLDGIVFYNAYLHYCYDTTSAYCIHNCDPTSLYCEILDSDKQPIYRIRYDTINQNSPATLIKHNAAITFYALNFDTLIRIKQGRFYVTITFGRDYQTEIPSIVLKLIEIPAGYICCDSLIYDYPFPLLQFENDSLWYNTIYKGKSIPYMSVYPRLNTTGYIPGSSNIENADNEEISVDVFPNPTKQEVNINCGYKIKTLQVFDEQGKLLFEKEVNAYNYQINLENYPTGTYLIKVQTNSGQATKKVIKE